MRNYALWQQAAEPPDRDDGEDREPTAEDQAAYARICNEAADERRREREAAYEAWRDAQEWQRRAVAPFPEDGESVPF